jgi:hypothetical protein
MKYSLFLPLFLMALMGCGPRFDLEVRVIGTKTDMEFINDGSVQLRFGKHEPLPPQVLDAKGRAYFKGIDGSYQQDTVSLIYLPNRPRRFRVVEQSTATAAAAGKPYIVFTIDYPPDFTDVMWSIRDKDGKGIEGATITIDKNMKVTTGGNGYFEVSIQKPAGDKAHFLIEKDGKVLMDKDVVIFPEYQRLKVE